MQIKYQIDINTGEHLAEERLRKNEIGQCDIMVAERIVFDKFCNHRTLGSFILIDRLTNMTSACGIIEHSLRRADNVVWQKTDITRAVRAERMNQKPVTIWFTGLSGSGKSTLANAVEKRLSLIGKYTMLLDGDNIRMGLNRNLGFTETDRVENIRRIAEVARLMNDAGLMVLTAFISPYRSDREGAADIIGQGEFFEIYVNTSLAECERRDIKGLYKKARQGEIPNFTGITSPYEPPVNPWLTIDTGKENLDECVERIMLALDKALGGISK
jgi:bifunctional enzyme CysN/CysC